MTALEQMRVSLRSARAGLQAPCRPGPQLPARERCPWLLTPKRAYPSSINYSKGSGEARLWPTAPWGCVHGVAGRAAKGRTDTALRPMHELSEPWGLTRPGPPLGPWQPPGRGAGLLLLRRPHTSLPADTPKGPDLQCLEMRPPPPLPGVPCAAGTLELSAGRRELASPWGLPSASPSSTSCMYPEQGETGSWALCQTVYFYILAGAAAGGSVGSWVTFALCLLLFTSHGR